MVRILVSIETQRLFFANVIQFSEKFLFSRTSKMKFFVSRHKSSHSGIIPFFIFFDLRSDIFWIEKMSIRN